MQSRPGPLISIVVPVLDESRMIVEALDRLRRLPGRIEVIVADGGSRDGTVALARSHQVRPRIVTGSAPSLRAHQLNEAARVAGGDVIVFLHADTRLPASAFLTLAAALTDRSIVGGNFRLRFDGADGFSTFMTHLARLLRRAGVYYGDSAVFVRPATFRRLGGFRPLPIMDDYDFVRRLESAGRTACLPGPAVTSSRRWRAQGVWRTLASWVLIQGLFMAGVPAARLSRLYRTVR